MILSLLTNTSQVIHLMMMTGNQLMKLKDTLYIERRCMVFIKYVEEKSRGIIDEYYEYIERLADKLMENKRLHIKDIAHVLGDELKKKGMIVVD